MTPQSGGRCAPWVVRGKRATAPNIFDPEGGACKNVVKLHQLRDSAQNRTIINNIDELAAFLEANFKNPTKSYFAKKGGGAIYQRHIHYVKLPRSK